MNGRFRYLGDVGFGTYEARSGAFGRCEGDADTLLIPGFVDIHIHGGFGFDFMSASSSAEVGGWADKLVSLGYESLLPTTVTASAPNVKRAISQLPDHPAIAGFHLEGPFISSRYPGAQPKEWILDPTEAGDEWDEIFEDPRLRIVTLAPEIPGASALIRRLAARGVIVSMGHTNATFSECAEGEAQGCSHTTHTFNAMRPLHHREAGTVGYALSSSDLSCELIYDRQHVSREAAAILIANKAPDKLIAISDASMAAGLPSGSTVSMWGLKGVVGDGNVKLEDGTLAGSAVTLLDVFRNLYEDFGPEVAIRACCLNPRQDLGLEKPSVYVELNGSLEIVARHLRPFG